MDIVVAIAGKVVELLIHPISRPIVRVYNYRTNVQDLKDQVGELSGRKKRLKRSVEDAIRRGEEIEDDVGKWLESMDAVIGEGRNVLNDEVEANKRCFMGICRDWRKRLKLSTKAEDVMKEAVRIMQKDESQRISYRPAPRGVGDRSLKDYEYFDSRTTVLNEIVDELKNGIDNMVGVYGLAGVGKTTLVKKVAVQVKADGIFDVVVDVVVSTRVSHTSDLAGDMERIQDEIGDGLGFRFSAASVKGRADELRYRLKQEKNILIILDDIRSRLELEDVGIPFGSDHWEGCRENIEEKPKLKNVRINPEGPYENILEKLQSKNVIINPASDISGRCKILMTSRHKNVLSDEMGARVNFPLGVLPGNEAWNLFEKTVGDCVKNTELKSVAGEVAKRCAGLPLSLIPVARALKDRTLSSWKDALEQLKRFDNSDDIVIKAFSALKLSYSSLPNAETKLLFLLCGQFQHRGSIATRDLLKYSMGLDLFKRSTVEDVRNRLHRFLDILESSCLLQKGDLVEEVVMHDAVDEFAKKVASEEHGVFTAAGDDNALLQWSAKDTLEQCTAISLRCSKIPELPATFDCPKLRSFLLYGDDPLQKIPENLFTGMKELRVLAVRGMQLSPILPSSLQLLQNLQTLCLDDCNLKDVAIIGELKALKVLSFMGSCIAQLPGEMRQLSQLQLLDLSNCTRLEVIPPNVLSCLTKLEDLYMANTFQQWELEGQHNQRSYASLAELKHLPNLIALHICVEDGTLFPNDLLFEKLERFRIAIGYEWTWFDKYETSRALKIMDNISPLKRGVELLLKKAEYLYLEELEGVKNALNELNGEGFPLLKHLHVKSSPGIQYIVDLIMMRPSIAFPLLEELSLDNLNKLEKICHGPDIPKSFSNLRILKVEICHKLKNLFSFSMATSLLRLEETVIRDCKMLEVIFAEETEGEADKAEVIKFSQLRTLTLESVPHFASICSKVNPPSASRTSRNLLTTNAGPQDIVAENEPQTPVPLFKRKIEFSNLRDLKLSSIKVEKIWHEQPMDLSSCVQSLTSLTVEGCGGLKYLFTSSTVIAFANLRKLQVCDCQVMKEVVTSKELGDGEIVSEMLFPKLEYLKLEGLPKLMRFCNGNFIEYPSLKELGIKNCPEMKAFISSTFVHANAAANREPEETSSSFFYGKIDFPNLEVLKLSSIKVEKIWDDQRLDPSCSIQKLTSLTVDGCGNLKYLFTSFIVESLVELKRLEISDCKSMEAVMLRKGLEERQFPKLDVLKLKDLPKLAGFGTDVAANCESEERNSTLFDEKVAFPNLERLSVFGMKNLEIIWHKQLHLDSFCKLKELDIRKGERILNIFPSNMLRRFRKLEYLCVTDCASLEEVFDIESLIHEKETHAVTAFQLRTMYIANLPRLKNVWNGTPIGILSFENLRKVIVWECPHLKYLFPVSIALGLLQFEALKVCSSRMERIVAEEEGLEIAPKFVFPKLTSITLWNLRRLNNFYPGRHALDCPILKVLSVYDCDNVVLFDFGFENFQGSSVVERPKMQLPIFSFKKIVPNLETLSLNGTNNITMIRQGQLSAEIFHKLKSLELQCFHDGLLQKCQNIEKLTIFDCQLKQLFPCKIVGEGECATSLARIRYLEIYRNHNLEQIWSKDFQMDQIQNLETLQVSFCRSLMSLAPSTASFKNLTSLNVWNCKGLVYLVTSSTAKSLAQLITMRVKECDMMREVVANRGDEVEYKITFKKLRSLMLDCLPSLTSFCSENRSFVFPSLIELLVKGCPRMKFFSKGTLSTPKLREVKLMEGEKKGHLDGDLNTTIQRLFPAGFRGLEVLELSDFPELQDTWHTELPGELFCDLKSLVVDDCASFPSAVSSNLLMFLNNLEKLAVRDCETLEEVFDLQGLDADKGHDGLLSKLEQLSLICLPRLVHVWTDFSRGTLVLKGLKVLKVHNCISLRNIFIPSMASVLVQLQELDVCSCPNIEEIITEGSSGQVEMEKIIFPRLRSIALASLPKLTRFYSGRGAVECPCLEVIRVIDCLSAFASSTFLKKQEPNATDSQVVFPSLEQLTLSSIKVEKIWFDQPEDPYSCIRNLTLLVVEGCGKLKYIFTPSMVESLAQLKELAILSCKLLEEIITTEGEIGSKMLFRKLEVLKLKSLPKVAKFCTTKTNTFVFNSTMGVDEAGSKKTISTLFDEQVAFPELKKLVLFNMDGLEMIWHDELLPNSFCKLKSINVQQGNKLLKIFPSSMLGRFQNLKDLFIIDCDLVEEVFNLQGPINEKGRHGATVTQLRNIYFESLPNLKNVWNGNPQGILSFENLRDVSVLDCPNLNSIFPTSVASNLLQLEMLWIRSCGVEEIVSEREGVEAVDFVFPRAAMLYLQDLPKLKRLHPRMHTSKWPALKKLAVELCDKIAIFDLEIESFQGSFLDNQVEKPLFSFKETMTNLEKLTLTSKHATMIRIGQFPSDHFYKVKSLGLAFSHYGSADFPFDLLQRFQNVEILSIAGRELKELFSSGLVGDAENTRSLARIQHLSLYYLYDLEHIWIQDFPVDQILPSLEALHVHHCNSLVNLAPATASFRQLKSLFVGNCKGLKYIITSSTARGLVQLTDMTVAECDMLTEIVASEKDGGENEIVFRKLRVLKLENLTSLTSFCSANFTFKFPSLADVVVVQCPKMKAFSYGVVRAPVLETVFLSVVKDEEQWKGDLNNTIMHINKAEGTQDSASVTPDPPW